MNVPSSGGGVERPERILVVGSRYLGDALLAIPFLRNLRRSCPDATIDVCVAGAARDALAGCPYVDDVVTWTRPPKGRSPLASLVNIRAEAAWLRGRGYARAYLLKRALSTALLAWLAGIPHRVGYASDGSRPFLTRPVPFRRGRHQVELTLDLLAADGIAVHDDHNENWIAAEAAALAAPLVDRTPRSRRRVFLAPVSTDPDRHWPLARWVELVTWMVTTQRCEIFLCGGGADIAAHRALMGLLPPRVATHVHDHSAGVPLVSAGALVGRMDLCVGVDTGLVHLAASFGVPTVVLVGPTDPNRWAPWGAPHAIVRSPRLRRPLRDRFIGRLGAAHRPEPRWPLGLASVADLGVAEVQAAVTALAADTGARAAPPPAGLRRLDLRTGSWRYEVLGAPASGPATGAVAPAEAATVAAAVR